MPALTRILKGETDVLAIGDPRHPFRPLPGGATFDGIVCDVMMPHLTGMELYRAIAKANPALAERFVFITGGTIHEKVISFLAEVPNERLEKPFSKVTLQETVQRVMRGNAVNASSSRAKPS